MSNVDELLRAAVVAVEAGRREVTERLIKETMASVLTPTQRATATWLLSSFDDGVRAASTIQALAALAEAVDDPALAKRIVWSVGMRCFWVEPGPEARCALLVVADRVLRAENDPATVAISAYLAPIDRASTVLAGLRTWSAVAGNDPEADRFLGSAALQVGAFDLAARFSAAAVPGLRAQGKLGLVARALAVQAWTQTRLGDLPTAHAAATEAAHLADETSQPYVSGLALAVQAEIAALRGDYDQATELISTAEKTGLAVAARPVLATAQRARALISLGQSRSHDAFADLLRMFDPAEPGYSLALRCYVLPELAEAANRSGRTELPELPETCSPALQIGLRYRDAVLAPSEKLFRIALEADLTAWPLDRARLQLAFGEWLRRQRRVADARPQLRAARDMFDALGIALWGDRARQELRAIGESIPNPHGKLTTHELTIAQLAAEGLTNREIGQRLFLSHRTVSTHLHRIFPKLGISSRAELAAVLAGYSRD
ncbi:MAG TPA: LuxR C-terminal-related transcriptional regulator [Pseudonocardiaceae bacterium]|nr:LuxR C-terminal-related transcriptional regulator [Pseudonocardiaceae bacterium]